MPRKDDIHEAIRNALIKDGWNITDDPFRIHYEDTDVYADMRVEKVEGESGVVRALVIEIKGFLEDSVIHSLEVALGQYMAYRTFLAEVAPELGLYFAIAQGIYDSHFQRKSFQLIVRKNKIALVVVDVIREEVVAWVD